MSRQRRMDGDSVGNQLLRKREMEKRRQRGNHPDDVGKTHMDKDTRPREKKKKTMGKKERKMEYDERQFYQQQQRLLDKGYDEDSEEYMEIEDQRDELDYQGRQLHQARMELQRNNNMKTTVKLQGNFSESVNENVRLSRL